MKTGVDSKLDGMEGKAATATVAKRVLLAEG